MAVSVGDGVSGAGGEILAQAVVITHRGVRAARRGVAGTNVPYTRPAKPDTGPGRSGAETGRQGYGLTGGRPGGSRENSDRGGWSGRRGSGWSRPGLCVEILCEV